MIDSPIFGAVIVAALAAAVQGIGFFFLTKNHLAHLQASCGRIEEAQKLQGERIARLEGELSVRQ